MSTRAARWTASLVAASAAAVLTGCGSGDDGSGSGAGSGELTMLAGFYPLEWTAARVGGELVSVSSLTPPGAEAHDLELAPQDVAAVAEADLLVYLAGFQPALDEAADSEGGEHAWDAGEAADLVAGEADPAQEEPAGHEDEGVLDPHFWLDPTRLAGVGDALADRFSELDPDNTATYAANSAALRANLEALDQEMETALSACSVSTLVTSHGAFGYLAERYGLEVVGISGLSPSQEPDPAQLAEITTLVRERGVTTVYTETLVDPAVAETVAQEAGVQTAVLDPLEGLTDRSDGADYLEVMRANRAVQQEGQSCT